MGLLVVVQLLLLCGMGNAQITCYTTTSSSGEFNCAGDSFGAASIEECCMNPTGHFFNGTGTASCTPCIVFGWFNATEISLQEQAENQRLVVGFIKGGNVQTLTHTDDRNAARFQIVVGGNATEGANADFTIQTTSFEIVGPDATEPFNLFITVRIDHVALETAEDFTLSLTGVNNAGINILAATMPGQFLSPMIRVVIEDTETINIGFQQQKYTVSEADVASGGLIQIPIIKENNQRSEIAFEVLASLKIGSGSTAAIQDQDFRANSSQRQDFDSNEQVINFEFELLNDEIPEPVQEFKITLSLPDLEEITGINLGASDGSLFARATVIIIDNDDVIIGWEKNVTVVNEIQGSLELCIGIMNLNESQELALTHISLAANTIRGTAADPDDYNALQDNHDVFPLITDTVRRVCIHVEINDTDLLEEVEYFSIQVISNPLELDFPTNVQLQPNVTFVEIQDNDFVTIGYDPVSYTVSEEGIANISIRLIQGDLTRLKGRPAITILVSAASFTATADVNFHFAPRTLRFDEQNTGYTLTVFIFDDDPGVFFMLAVSSDDRVQITPDHANVTIIDDDDSPTFTPQLTEEILQPSTSPTPPINTPESSSVLVIILPTVLVPFGVGICILILLCLVHKRNHKRSLIQKRARIRSDSQTKKNKSKVPNNISILLNKELIVASSQLRLQDCIGQGEFGVVYRACLTIHNNVETVAVKTLKGLYAPNDVDIMLKEVVKMQNFNHSHVMSLLGVCMDAGPGISIIMPFMANGSLLTYLKKDRENLFLSQNTDSNTIGSVTTLLLRMCFQIAQGMEYLALQKFLHRDLAARNCMLDINGDIKVADFGLGEDIYMTGYFRQDKGCTMVKLPYKWMPLESIQDGLFSEKSDVWAFGVTCWEIYTAGKMPYPATDPATLVEMLERGERLKKPSNSACSDEIYSLIERCWCAEPRARPGFENLVTSLSKLLESTAGYLKLSL